MAGLVQKGLQEDGEETAEVRVSFLSHLGYNSPLGVCVLMSKRRRPGMKTSALTHLKKTKPTQTTHHFCLFGST